MTDDSLARIRRFNRAVTVEVGALDQSYLGRGRPLGPARVLISLPPEGREVGDLRASLALDSGLMSRILRGLEEEGLVETLTDPQDRRRRIARPTAAGLAEIAAYQTLSEDRAALMLKGFPADRDDLLAAMDRITVILNRDRIAIAIADPAGPAAACCLSAYYAELALRFGGGFDPGPSGDGADLRAPQGAFLVADCDGAPVGCVGLRPDAPGVGEVKRLWIAPAARGLGLGSRLMTAVEAEARGLGFCRLRLDTNSALTEAIAMYRRAGWREIPRYNDNPHAQHWFERDL